MRGSGPFSPAPPRRARFTEAPDVSPLYPVRALSVRALRFKQSSLHHAVRASTGTHVCGFLCVLPFRPCYCPLWLSPPGKVGDPGVSRSPPPVFHGDQLCRDAAHLDLSRMWSAGRVL